METTQNQIARPNAAPSGETQTALMAAQAKALVEARYSMALYRPRDMFEVQQRLEKECKRPSFAENAVYAKPVGGKSITGPSIRFAETAARLAGNISVESLVVLETAEKRLLKIIVSDCETNAVYSQDIVIDKTVERSESKGREVVGSRTNSFGKPVFIVKATEDELQNKQLSLISKSIRNQVLRLIPVDIVESCMALCKETMNDSNAKDPDSAKKKLVSAFNEINVQVAELTKYLGHPLDAIKPEEITDLRQIYKSIQDGETTWRAVMEAKGGEAASWNKAEEKPSKIENLKNEINAKLGKNPVQPAAELKEGAPPAKQPLYASQRDAFNAEIYGISKTHHAHLVKKLVGAYGYESTAELPESQLAKFLSELREAIK